MDHLPEEAFYFVTSMSDKALAYISEPLGHRILVIAEAAAVQSETFEYMLRALISEGELRHVTVDRDQ